MAEHVKTDEEMHREIMDGLTGINQLVTDLLAQRDRLREALRNAADAYHNCSPGPKIEFGSCKSAICEQARAALEASKP
jgi:hypothetical protein